MRKRTHRTTPLFVLAAMLFALVATILPTGVSADHAEIENFGYQTCSAADVLDDETDLRFVFTIGSLAYDEVGIICSKTVDTPTYGAGKCYTYVAERAYRSITADGETENAPAGRWWIAVKMTDVPHSYFDGTLYLRAFVSDGEGVRYSDVKTFTVCSALGHTHVLPWDAEGSATMQTAGTLSGHCDGCGLDVSLSGVKRDPVIYNSAEPDGPFAALTTFLASKDLSEVRGEDHFYPTQEHPEGQDLFFEYSFLWNETLVNWDYASALAEIKVFSLRNKSTGKYSDFYYLYTRDNNSPFKTSSDCPFAGHFDFSTYSPDSAATVLYGSNAGFDSPVKRSSSPYVYDSERANVGGWHRIGVRFHQEAAKSGANVVYSGWSELYLDGVIAWRVQTNTSKLQTNGQLLYTAAVDGDELVYADNDNVAVQLRIDGVTHSTDPVYIAVGDVRWSCGDSFEIEVKKDPCPAAATLDLDENVTVDAPLFYTENKPAPDPDRSFTIANWNIGHFSFGKSKNSSISDGAYDASLTKYRTYIDDVVGADLICLNEYSALFTPSHPASDLFGSYAASSYEGEQRRYSCNAIWSKLPLTNITVHEFACNVGKEIQYTNAVEATDYYYVTAELEIGGETVTIVAAHLAFDDYLYEVPPYVDTVCTDEMDELISVFENVERVVIIGDFNAYDYDYFYRFADAGYTLGNGDGAIMTCTGSSTGDLEWPVDNILVKGLTITDFYAEPTRLSDHVAVIATISLAD